MRRFRPIFFLVLILGCCPGIWAWGYEGHRRINHQAVTLVPESFGDFLLSIQDSLAIHAPDPDEWRKADPDEGRRHYIDADYYAAYPFDAIPRDLDLVKQIYSVDSVKNWGTGPWAIVEISDQITELMRSGQWNLVLIPLAALGHYVADLHMPLHVVANYNGQMTGNDGIHFRWESRMVDEWVTTITPVGKVEKINDPLEQAFTIVKQSYALHQRLLSGDKVARSVLTPDQARELASYNDLPFEAEYLKLLYNTTNDVVHDRLGRAVVQVAAYWYTCWIRAGSPEPPKH